MNTIRVQYSDTGPMIEVPDIEELDQLLDDFASKASPDCPTIIFVYAHDYQVSIGLGCKESFIHIEHESGNSPYLITLGEGDPDGVLPFYLFNCHHTEIPRRYLIPIEKAREILNTWIKEGVRSKDVKWIEI